jgi:hypothetical protein
MPDLYMTNNFLPYDTFRTSMDFLPYLVTLMNTLHGRVAQ